MDTLVRETEMKGNVFEGQVPGVKVVTWNRNIVDQSLPPTTRLKTLIFGLSMARNS